MKVRFSCFTVITHFAFAVLLHRYGDCHPVFYIGTLEDAIKDALHARAKEVSVNNTTIQNNMQDVRCLHLTFSNLGYLNRICVVFIYVFMLIICLFYSGDC